VLVRFGVDIPGLGFAAMVLLILLVGFLSRNLVGTFLFRFVDRMISNIPLARVIYSAVRDVMKAFAVGSKEGSFRQVVLVEYPRVGVYTIGFVTNTIEWRPKQGSSTWLVSVYFPHPPNPTSGVMVLVPRSHVIVLDISVEEGLKLALSGGIVAPTRLKASGMKQTKPHSS
jgi:uncharacterized membrane protein